MPRPEDAEFIEYVDKLIESTRSGTIEWKAVNPSTIVWETDGARLSLQRLERAKGTHNAAGRPIMVKIVSYIFQAFEVRGSAVKSLVEKMSVESDENDAINKKLDALYEAAKTATARKGLDFLKGILPKA